ncbi:MAG: MBL fold metallo-hydrolase, partial [Pseudomonadota bacterium]
MKTKQLAALALGGVGHIGTNMMVYECNGDLIVVDAGVSFPDESTPGVDIIIPDTRFLRDHAKQIKAVFITHAHEDH